MDVVTYAAAVGAAKKYTDEHSGGGSSDAVKYTEQTLTDAQKTQARTNIGAGTSNFSGNYDDLDNAPDMTFIQPEISDMVDSGIGWRAKQAYYTDTAGNPQYYLQCLSYSDKYNVGYSLKINNGPSICAFIRDPSLIWGVYLLSTVESAAVINYTESRTSPIETISPVASNSWYIAGRIINIGNYDPGKYRNYPDIILPSDSAFRNADFGTDAATRAEAVRIILEAAHAIPPTSFNVPTVECTEQRYANAVKYTAQTLTDAQKSQARTNIGAGTSNFSGSYSDLTNAPPLAKGYGNGGNMIGGSGVNKNSTSYSNSIAYGAFAGATADHALAFGNYAFTGSNYGGKHAVAIGYEARAERDYALAIGNNVRADRDYEWAIGKFNQTNPDTAFAYGNGTGDRDRHNLMELKTDGTLLLNGNAVKTEGGDDKLRLGTVFNNGKYGIGEEGNEPCNSVEFSTEYPSNSSESFVCKDFVISLYTYQYTVVPLKGLATGRTTTGVWVHAENCYRMFFKTGAVTQYLKTLDLSMIDTSEVSDMTQMFYGCTSLETLDISSFDMSNVIEYTDMFTNDTALTTLKCPKINPHDDIALPRTLYSQDGTAYTNLPVTTGTSIELRQSWT